MTLPASKTRIDKAGDVLRRRAQGTAVEAAEFAESRKLVQAFRAAHSYPLTSVAMGLRHHAKKASNGAWFDISQRLKQFPTIMDKLDRMEKTKLARMQDIGGCRATFLDQDTVDRAIASITERAKRKGGAWEILGIDDYVHDEERHDGYRAKHVIVRKYDVRIEIQFRTAAQHNWAQLVEDLDKALGLGLKQQRAPDWAVACVAAAAADMREYELGRMDRPALMKRINASLAPLLEESERRIA